MEVAMFWLRYFAWLTDIVGLGPRRDSADRRTAAFHVPEASSLTCRRGRAVRNRYGHGASQERPIEVKSAAVATRARTARKSTISFGHAAPFS